MNYIKFHPVSDTRGYAVEKIDKGYQVIFVQKHGDKIVKLSVSYSNCRRHLYSSPFLADYAIRNELLPLYRKVA